MTMTDPIADMLTRIRNANTVGHETVEIPASNMKKAIAEILKNEGFIADYEVIEDNKQGMIRVTMKYGANKERVISGIKKISKPGLKKYAKAGEIPKDPPFTHYLRTLPLHHSQKELAITPEYADFELFLHPTFDFLQELFSQMNEVEVLEPESLRTEVKGRLARMMARYE